jgi:hypothetical protein
VRGVGIVGIVVGLGVVAVIEQDSAACYAVVCPVVNAAIIIGVWACYIFAGCLWSG